jgi:myo-inositol-1(or 4)-monophosphatase
MDLTKEREFAVKLAIQGGQTIQQELASIRGTEAIQRRWPEKQRTEVKTRIDKTVDNVLVQEIQTTFPDDAIHSEESAFRPGKSGRTWINDPIDGTLNLQGPIFGTFGVCVALADRIGPVLGVVYSPNVQTGQRGQLWIGEQGKKSLYSPDYPNIDPTEIHVSNCTIRNQAIGGFDSGKHDRAIVYPYLKKLDHDTNGVTCLYRIASASMSLAAVVNGDWDFYGATSLEPEDMAAMVPILTGAGALVTAINGGVWAIKEPSILAANPTLHADLLQYLRT